MGGEEDQGKLNAQEIKDLSDELAALAKKQSDARETEVYLRMTPPEIKDFDTRKDRISRIRAILGKHDSKREST
jgi:polyhydroxyalkanoate synthesis regulator phasin